MRTLRLLAAALAGALMTLGAIAALATAAARAALPPVKHTFIIVLENKDYEESFGAASKAPYLAKTLTAKGQLLTQYFGTSHASLGNYISLISGQAPNPQTQGDCMNGFNDIFPGTPAPDGQALGTGCVYPTAIKTIADQLGAEGLPWKAYMQDMGNSTTQPKTCRHPDIGQIDDTQKARVGDQYAVRHNPFVYFHSIIDDRATCDASVVPLDGLPQDLQQAQTTPAYSFISPNLCDDGHDDPCVDGRPGGLVSADAFLKAWVPQILGSPAYTAGGMLVITWDEGQISPDGSKACCDEPSGPNTPMPGIFGPGGGRTGAIVISPWTKPGTTNGQPYNHYALLRSVEDLYGLDHLGYAAQKGLKPFGDDVFDRPQPRGTVGTDTNTTPTGARRTCTTHAWVARTRGKRYVIVRSARAARVRVASDGRRIASRRVAACRKARIAIPDRGRLSVRVAGKRLR